MRRFLAAGIALAPAVIAAGFLARPSPHTEFVVERMDACQSGWVRGTFKRPTAKLDTFAVFETADPNAAMVVVDPANHVLAVLQRGESVAFSCFDPKPFCRDGQEDCA